MNWWVWLGCVGMGWVVLGLCVGDPCPAVITPVSLLHYCFTRGSCPCDKLWHIFRYCWCTLVGPPCGTPAGPPCGCPISRRSIFPGVLQHSLVVYTISDHLLIFCTVIWLILLVFDEQIVLLCEFLFAHIISCIWWISWKIPTIWVSGIFHFTARRYARA